jgi:hypothetical protein
VRRRGSAARHLRRHRHLPLRVSATIVVSVLWSVHEAVATAEGEGRRALLGSGRPGVQGQSRAGPMGSGKGAEHRLSRSSEVKDGGRWFRSGEVSVQRGRRCARRRPSFLPPSAIGAPARREGAASRRKPSEPDRTSWRRRQPRLRGADLSSTTHRAWSRGTRADAAAARR